MTSLLVLTIFGPTAKTVFSLKNSEDFTQNPITASKNSEEGAWYPPDFDLIKYLNNNPNDYRKVWEQWLSKAAVHAIATSEDGNFLAVGGGYLYDNEVHIYRWNLENHEYDKVWDSGDGIIKGDVLSLAWGDTDNNHFMEIVAGSADGHIYVFEQRHIYDPVTKTENQFEHVWTSPMIRPVFSVKVEDTDKDFLPDIISGSWDGKVRAYEYTRHSGYPFSAEHWIKYEEVWNSGNNITEKVYSITVADTNYNGLPEIVAGTRNGTIYIFENAGTNMPLNNVPFPITNDNNYRLIWNSSTFMWRPIRSLAAGDLDGDPNDEIAATAMGQGVYVIDYDVKSARYRLHKLTCPLESWERKGFHPLDYYVDDLLNAKNVFYRERTGLVYEEWKEPLEYEPEGPVPLSIKIAPKRSAMIGPPDGNYSIFRPGATAVLDFGNDEEATGNGNNLPDLNVTFIALGLPFADAPNFKQLKFSISMDLTEFVEIEQEDLQSSTDTERFFVYVNLDNALAKNRWDHARYLRITVYGEKSYAIDSIEAKTLYRPLYTATTATIGTLRLNSTNLNLELTARSNGLTGSDYEEWLEMQGYEKEYGKVIVGTVEGELLAFTYDSTSESYSLVWDSYSTSVGKNALYDWFSMETNIWAIEEVKTQGKIPTWLTSSLELPRPIEPDNKVYASMTWSDIDQDSSLEAIVGTKNGTLEAFSDYLREHEQPTTDKYFSSINGDPAAAKDPWYPNLWLSASFGQLNAIETQSELIVGYFGASGAEFGGNPAEDLYVGAQAGMDYWIYEETIGYNFSSSLTGMEVTGGLSLALSKSLTLPKACLHDTDGDGDLDMTITNGKIYYLENIGNTTLPIFAMKLDYYSSINLESPGKVFSGPQLKDLDRDGDLDLVVGFANKNGATYYENTGNAENPEWAENKWLFSNRRWNFKSGNFTDVLFYHMEDMPGNITYRYFKAHEETFGTNLTMSAYNTFSNTVSFFYGDIASHSRFIIGTNPKVASLEVSLADGILRNYGYHVLETWNNNPDLERWTITVTSGNVDSDGRNEVIVGDYDNNLYVFEHLTNNTYKRAFRSFDFNHSITSAKSPYAWKEFEGISGNFNRTIWDHVEHLIVDTDLDNDTRKEIIAAADLSIYVFEWTGVDDEFMLVWREDLRNSIWASDLESMGIEKITALSFHKDLDYNGYGEIIAAAGSILFVYESNINNTFQEIYQLTKTGRYFLPGNPLHPMTVDVYSNLVIHAITTGNTDSDQYNEIVIGGVNKTQSLLHPDGFVAILENHIGTYHLAWTAPREVTYRNPVNNIVIDDQDYDGMNEIMIGHEHGIDIWEHAEGTDNQYAKMEVMTSSPNYPTIDLTAMFNLTDPTIYGRNTDILQLSNGTIVQVYSNRTGDILDPTLDKQVPEVRLFIKTSNDNGTTWTPAKRLNSYSDYEDYWIRYDIDYSSAQLLQELEPSITEIDGEFWITWRAVYAGRPLGTMDSAQKYYDIIARYYNYQRGVWGIHGRIVSSDESFAYSPSIYGVRSFYEYPFGRYSDYHRVYIFYINSTDGRVHYYMYGYHDWTEFDQRTRQWESYRDWLYEYQGALPHIGSDESFRYEASSIDIIRLNEASIGIIPIGLSTAGYALAFAGRYKNETKIDYDIWVMTANLTGAWEAPVRVTVESTYEGRPSLTQLESKDATILVVFESYGGAREERIQISYSKDLGRSWSEPEPLPFEPPYITAYYYEGITYYTMFDTYLVEPVTSFSPSVAARNNEGFLYSVVCIIKESRKSARGPWEPPPLLDIPPPPTPRVWRDISLGVNPSSKWTKYDIASVHAMDTGDTDNDGRREIASNYKNMATVFELVQANSSHQERTQVWISSELPESINDISIGDGNGNGWQEILVAAEGGNVYSFETTDTTLPRTSLRASAILWNYPVSSQKIYSLRVGTFDHDAKPDIATGAGDDIIATKADGTLIWNFTDPIGQISDLAVEDLDGNGVEDVVVGDLEGVIYVINGSDGTQLWKFTNPTGKDISRVQIGDVNSDGLKDVVAGTHDYTGDANVYAFDGLTGTALWNFTASNEVHGLAVGNLTGQSHMNIIVATSNGSVYALAGENGSPLWSFTDTGWYSMPATSDLNRDGLDDVIISGSAIFALHGLTRSQLWNNTNVKGTAFDTRVADLNGDGTADVIAGYSAGILAVDGSTGETLWTYDVVQGMILSMTTADFNNDEITDIALTHREDPRKQQGVLVVLDGSRGNVIWAFNTPTEVQLSLTASDFNLDGVADIAVGTDSGKVYVVHSVSLGVSIPITINILPAAWDTALPIRHLIVMVSGDFNGDGIDDIASSDYECHIYTISGTNGSKLWEYTVDQNVTTMTAAHLTSQRDLDVIVGTERGKIYAFEGSALGDGDLLWEVDLGSWGSPSFTLSLATGNLDSDWKEEVVAYGWLIDRYAVVAIDHNGDVLGKYLLAPPSTINGQIYGLFGKVKTGDIDKDGLDEVVAFSDKKVYAINETGETALWNFSVPTGPVVSLDLGYFMDETEDIVVSSLDDETVYAIDGLKGKPLWNFSAPQVHSVVVGKFRLETSKDDIAALLWGSQIALIDGTKGEKTWAFENPAIYSKAFGDSISIFAPPLAGDTNGDGLDEIITINWNIVYALNSSGVIWTSFAPSNRITATALGNFDANEHPDVAVGTFDGHVYAILDPFESVTITTEVPKTPSVRDETATLLNNTQPEIEAAISNDKQVKNLSLLCLTIGNILVPVILIRTKLSRKPQDPTKYPFKITLIPTENGEPNLLNGHDAHQHTSLEAE
jgi:outer membrane protein assembly factor BamB